MAKHLRYLAALLLAIAVIFSVYKANSLVDSYKAIGVAYADFAAFRPQTAQKSDASPSGGITNSGIVSLKEKNHDVLGWITIPHTAIDYPFVQAADNAYYLHRDLNGDYLYAGTTFMDYRNAADFSDGNTILYGHSMKDGSMFANLRRFADREFFEVNNRGTIFLADQTLQVEFFAFVYADARADRIYSRYNSKNTRIVFLEYLRKNAANYRDIGASESDSFVTLSTCVNSSGDERMVLIGRIVR